MGALSPLNKSYWLQRVCEDNYTKLLQLVPDMDALDNTALHNETGQLALHLLVLERTPYTVTLELTHYFADEPHYRREPAVHVRVFLDAKLAEVLCADAAPSPHEALRRNPAPKAVLDYKWRLNYFLQKWLSHCLEQNYRPAYGA